MEIAESLKLLGLSKKEHQVLGALQGGHNTPVKIAAETDISRTAIYAILQNLKKRGIVSTHIRNGKKQWGLASEQEIEEVLHAAKRTLLQIPEGREEVYGLSDSSVIVHRGSESIRALFSNLLSNHQNERFYAFQGDAAVNSWNKVFSIAETNRFNQNVKKNGIIVEALLPDGWFERQMRELGVEWAKEFEGRMTRVNVIDPEYFRNGGQVFVFKQSVYLIALGEEVVIEIRNSEIQKMLLSFFRFMQDNSSVIDANEILRTEIEKVTQKNNSNTSR